jgi:hypothetical protein
MGLTACKASTTKLQLSAHICQVCYTLVTMSENDTPKTTPADVAQWMLTVIQEQGELTQNNAYYQINKQFGTGFTTVTNSGSPSIKTSVLTAFKKISDDSVIWERGDKKWRKREFYDAPGRQQY